MPTLPERATSILAVLARHTTAPPVLSSAPAPTNTTSMTSVALSSAPASTSIFDWQALVRDKKPGSQTEVQRQQALRVRGTLSDLRDWAQRLELPAEHTEESALYAVVSTPPTTSDTRALALAMVVLWIYLLDDFLDRRDVAALDAAQTSQDNPALAGLDRDLAAILAPLAADVDRKTLACLSCQADGTPPSPDAALLARALAALLEALAAEWARLPGMRWGRRLRRALVATHFAECALAMRHELLWNVAFARARAGYALPGFDAYLRNGTVSIGMPAVAAAAASFEPRPRRAWKAAGAAVAAGGDIVRLTNDLHTYFADLEEGKVTSITIRRWAMGDTAIAAGSETSPEVLAAQISLSADLARAIAAFSEAQAALPDGPLAYCVRHAVAFALAVYGDGSRYRKRAA